MNSSFLSTHYNSHVKETLKHLEYLVNATPTGEVRNRLINTHISLMNTIDKLTEEDKDKITRREKRHSEQKEPLVFEEYGEEVMKIIKGENTL